MRCVGMGSTQILTTAPGEHEGFDGEELTEEVTQRGLTVLYVSIAYNQIHCVRND